VSALVEIHGVVKSYLSQSLRPLRIQDLTVSAGDRLNLRGFDAGAAEMFVHLVTGAALPDEGTVRIADKDTRDIATDTEWLNSLDRFGIVTHRAVLIDQISLASNLALPLTVSIDPMPADIRARVERLASDAGFEPGALDRTVAGLTAENRLRLHLARAVANGPEMLMLEHPTAQLSDREASSRIGETLGKLSNVYQFGWIALTEDDAFAEAARGTVLELNPSTGKLAAPKTGWRSWFKS